MKLAKTTTNGRATIPAKLRKKYGLTPGCKVVFKIVDDGINITPLITPDEIVTNIGFLGTKGILSKALAEEKKRVRKI